MNSYSNLFKYSGQRRLPIYDLISLLWCTTLLLLAWSLQFVQHLAPCPLCILQRGIYLVLISLYVVALFIYPRSKCKQILYHSVLLIIGSVGLLIAGRHWLLQQLPPDPFRSCSSHLAYYFRVLPWHDAILKIFNGGADCHQVAWQFLSISLAGWSFIGLSVVCILTLLALWQVISKV